MELEIDKIRDQFFKDKFQNELDDNDDNDLVTTTSERSEHLTKIINSLNKDNNSKEKDNKLDSFLDNIKKYTYMKPWKNLKEFHKREKLNEYIKTLKTKDEQNKIKNMVDSNIKKLMGTKHVVYDSANMQIKEIKNIDS